MTQVLAVLLFLAALLAFSLSAISGGGASLLLIPLLGALLPAPQVPVALTLGTAASSVSRLAVFHQNIRWRIVAWFVPAALPAVWLGAWLLTYVNPLYIELGMGLFMIANVPMALRSSKAKAQERQSSHFLLLLIGFLTGFLSGLTGAVGLLFNRFYLGYGLTKEQIVATRAANELLLHLLKLGLYISFGLMTAKALEYGLAISVAGIASAWLAKRLLAFVSENLFKRIGYASMALAGVGMLYNAGSGVAQAERVHLTYKLVADGADVKFLWQDRHVEMEFAWDEGFEFEHKIDMSDLPLDKQAKARELSLGADQVLVEEGFGIGKHFYEVYVLQDGKVVQYEI